jgi:methylmalonyl-CoA/ethylmalonyl-CoA epimerase
MVVTLSDLESLRKDIDDIDKAIVELLAKRMDACRSIAEVKARTKAQVIQPERVRNVLVSRRQWAIDAAIDPDFADQIFRAILAETHRIELLHDRGGEAPKKDADTLTSALDTVAVRIDHVVVAVTNLDTASSFLETVGFSLENSSDPGIRVANAGGVTVVLVGPDGDPAVRKHLDEHGSGVQHIAIEVLNAKFVQTALAEAGIPMLTDVVVDAAGHEQLFTVKDPATGVQIGFISRTGHREAISGDNVRALFRALDAL